ncbi:undecaprenyl phosphate translocase family protein, partial [Psychrobacter sp. 1Y1]|uniref:undecaprenyl phosphate translocase family protein n=1 Tax=Psychrobacter sp. 1Y1 TaxID=3453574 RepID=UPI003F47F490
FDIAIMATFAAGAAIGILSFSHVLSALLRKYHDATLVFLTGLMLGTLGKIWPWKEVLTFRENSKGQMVPLDERIISPMQYEHLTGQPSLVIYAVIAMFAGILLVWGLERFAQKSR